MEQNMDALDRDAVRMFRAAQVGDFERISRNWIEAMRQLCEYGYVTRDDLRRMSDEIVALADLPAVVRRGADAREGSARVIR